MSTQGNARDALSAARPIIAALIEQQYNVETWGLHSRLQAIDAALATPPDSDALREDAERWRALMSSQRMHFMGCAGIDLVNKPGTTDRKTANLIPVMKPGEYQHFGMEFWSEHSAFGNTEFPDDFERSLLIAYVDHLRAALSNQGSSSNGQ